MSRLTSLTAAAALAAVAFVPASADAYGCMPHLYEDEKITVAGYTVTTYRYEMIC